MKILAITHYYIEENRAGGELMFHAILKKLAEDNDVTVLITNTKRKDTTIDGVKVKYGKTPKDLEKYEHDMVVTQFENTPFCITHCRNKNKRLCLVVHNDMWLTQDYVNALKPTDFVIYNSNWIRDKFTTPCKSVVVHPPVERRGSKYKNGKYVTLVNLVWQKGADVFYEIARCMPDVQFLGVQGGYWKEQQIIDDPPNVKLIEQTDNMFRDVYSKSKIVLMPSTYESFGMVAAEAISCGIPVICTDTQGLKENLGDAGIYFERRYIGDWIEEIEYLLNDEEHYNNVSDRCLEQSRQIDTESELKALTEALWSK